MRWGLGTFGVFVVEAGGMLLCITLGCALGAGVGCLIHLLAPGPDEPGVPAGWFVIGFCGMVGGAAGLVGGICLAWSVEGRPVADAPVPEIREADVLDGPGPRWSERPPTRGPTDAVQPPADRLRERDAP